ncbi:MAG: hypothetical protein WEK74_14645, partial [Hydrogenophaga sp.]
MTNWNLLWLMAAAAPVLIALGAVAHRLWAARAERDRRRIPKHWPLTPRAVVNSEELRVWHWLSRAFYDQQIMIKLPVTRFTLPRDMEKGMAWYRLLNGVYCSFTVCTAEGRVIGCIDVLGQSAMPRSTRLLKHSLLTQCELPYWLVRSGSLPTVSEIRAEFLGETPTAQTLRERENEER